MTDKKSKVGRPTKYKPEYCEMLVDFFNKEPTAELTDKGHIIVNGKLPTFEGFAKLLQISVDTLHEWKKVNPEFSESYTRAKAMQRDVMIQNGLTGAYNPAFTKFVLSCNHDMHETTNQNVSAEVSEKASSRHFVDGD